MGKRVQSSIDIARRPTAETPSIPFEIYIQVKLATYGDIYKAKLADRYHIEGYQYTMQKCRNDEARAKADSHEEGTYRAWLWEQESRAG